MAAEIFVAVGGEPGAVVSADGDTWTNVSTGTGTLWQGVGYGNNRWVAVGGNGATWSTDGETFNNVVPPSATWFSVAYGAGVWVAVGQSTGGDPANPVIMRSTDGGKTWTATATGTSLGGLSDIRHVAYGAGRFVAACEAGGVAISTDGATWTFNGSAPGGYGITFDGTQFVSCGYDTRGVSFSADGTSWSTPTTPGGISRRAIAYGGGAWLVGMSSRQIFRSTDLVSWTEVLTSGTGQCLSLEYGNGVWVAGFRDGTRLRRSADGGLTWAASSSLLSPGSGSAKFGLAFGAPLRNRGPRLGLYR